MADNLSLEVSNPPIVCEVEDVLRIIVDNDVLKDAWPVSDYFIKISKYVSSWMCDPQRNPEEIYELIGPKFNRIQDGTVNKLTQAFLAAVVFEAYVVINERKKIVLTGHWAKIARCMINYFHVNKRPEDDVQYNEIFNTLFLTVSKEKLSWMLNACNAEICPNYSLRLDIFYFISDQIVHTETGFIGLSKNTKKQMGELFVRIISELDSVSIYNLPVHELCFETGEIKYFFDKFYHDWLSKIGQELLEFLDLIGHEITESLMHHASSRVVTFFRNLFKLTEILTYIARFKFQSKSRFLRKRLNDSLTLFLDNFTSVFEGIKNIHYVCRHPFIYPYYIDLLSEITRGIMDLSGILNKWSRNKTLTRCRQIKFRRLVTRRNYMEYCGDFRHGVFCPPLLMKRELGILTRSGRAELEKNALSQPNIQLNFNNRKNKNLYEFNDECYRYGHDNEYENDDENDDVSFGSDEESDGHDEEINNDDGENFNDCVIT